ncbi:MAG: hypothetical protein JXR91_11515 [Deltaproteobacteria bacterium]|nr:hypothetical protein [Deltaproteobacteria bacterium]
MNGLFNRIIFYLAGVLIIACGGSSGNKDTEFVPGDTSSDSETASDTDTDTDTDSDTDTDTDADTDTDSETGSDTSVNEVTINQTGFENLTNEYEFVQSSWTDEGFTALWVNGFNQGRAHVDTAYANTGDASLRIDYPAGGVGPGETGAQVPLAFKGESEVYVTYALRFSDDFDWGGTNEGGKLPGLGSGDNCSGGSTCDGTNGFSARLMWRDGGRGVLYLYHMDKPATWGEDIQLTKADGSDVVFEKGKWYTITERVKINTGDNNDGEVQVWVDGIEALNIDGIKFVNNGDLIDNFYFSTFHGGNTPDWAPSVDCHIWFDDIRIYKIN